MNSPSITEIAWGRLEGVRPRHAGSNARLGAHGINVRPPIAKITLSDGSSGFGFSNGSREQATALVGKPLDAVFADGVLEPGLPFEYPLWDLAGKRTGQPVYALIASAPVEGPLRVPCYDTSLYFDDLDLASEAEAAALIAEEARAGFERGHRAFKIKVGRGAMHLPLEEGTCRDIAIIRAVREAVGSQPPIMIDANNGYNLNLAKRVLEETADCGIFWLEEAFHEDRVLYEHLRVWLKEHNLPILIADGEGQASPTLLDWARDGVVDVIQYDVFSYGFTKWLTTGRQLDGWNVRSAPHHYGGLYGNYAAAHLASAIRGFTYVEWDEASAPGLDPSGYAIHEGYVEVPATPGFGLALDDELFDQIVAAVGWRVGAS